MLEVKITGLAELDKALRELPDKIQRNVVRAALRQGSKAIVAEARQQLVGHDRTGHLSESIRASVRLRRGVPHATVTAGDKRAYYAHMVEFGTAAHFIKPKKSKSLFFAGLTRNGVDHPGARRVPFMRTTLDTAAQAALQAFADQVRKRLTKQGINTPDVTVEDLET